MKLLKNTLNIKEHLEFLSDLIFHNRDSILILDTNILIWLYRVNKEARQELFDWFKDLKHDNLITIPSWSIHEYNNHLQQKKDEVFFPLRTLGKSLRNNLIELDNYASLIANHKLVKDSGFLSRSELLTELNESSGKINKILNCLNKVKEENSTSVRNEIEDFVGGIIMDSDIYSLQQEINLDVQNRFNNRIPPGFKDKNKTDNSIGDLIIWKEILNHCKNKGYQNAIFLTLDNKTDWIAYPEKVIIDGGKTINYNKDKFGHYFFTTPSLAYEFSTIVGENTNFRTINIKLLAELLSNQYTGEESNYYPNLSQAVKYNWDMSETEKLSIWLGERKDLINDAINGVCKWESCPSEIDTKKLKLWIIEKTELDLNYENINWGTIIVDHFV
ncbi:PIN domain-containing protein [Labilibaculum euxinus]